MDHKPPLQSFFVCVPFLLSLRVVQSCSPQGLLLYHSTEGPCHSHAKPCELCIWSIMSANILHTSTYIRFGFLETAHSRKTHVGHWRGGKSGVARFLCKFGASSPYNLWSTPLIIYSPAAAEYGSYERPIMEPSTSSKGPETGSDAQAWVRFYLPVSTPSKEIRLRGALRKCVCKVVGNESMIVCVLSIGFRVKANASKWMIPTLKD